MTNIYIPTCDGRSPIAYLALDSYPGREDWIRSFRNGQPFHHCWLSHSDAESAVIMLQKSLNLLAQSLRFTYKVTCPTVPNFTPQRVVGIPGGEVLTFRVSGDRWVAAALVFPSFAAGNGTAGPDASARRTLAFQEWEAWKMRDPEFRAEAEEQEPFYQLARAIIKYRTKHGLWRCIGAICRAITGVGW